MEKELIAGSGRPDSLIIKKGAKDITWEIKIYFDSEKEGDSNRAKICADEMIKKVKTSISSGQYQ